MVSNLNLLESRRRILLTTPHLESPTPANPLTFKSNMSAKLKEGKVYFTPVQEGTGDPSPDNVRPISGWDGITVTKCGKNLFDKASHTIILGRGINYSTGELSGLTSSSRGYTDYIAIKGGQPYTLSSTTLSMGAGSTWGLAFYDSEKTYISGIANTERTAKVKPFTSPDNASFFRATFTAITSAEDALNEIQLELGSEATAYEPYTGTQITIPFPQTIYGGYVDMVNGEVVETRKQTIVDENSAVGIFPWHGVKIDSATGTEYATALFRRINDCPRGNNWASNLCDKLPYSTSPNKINHAYFYDGDIYGPAISLPTSLIGTTNETLKQYLSENLFVFCYRLRTPIHHTIDPQVIRPLKGVNNIYSDANGNIEIKYWKH